MADRIDIGVGERMRSTVSIGGRVVDRRAADGEEQGPVPALNTERESGRVVNLGRSQWAPGHDPGVLREGDDARRPAPRGPPWTPAPATRSMHPRAVVIRRPSPVFGG